MAQGQEGRVLVPEAKQALSAFKYEIANEIGVRPPAHGYWGELTSRDCGAVGGQMVKRMIEIAERSLAGRTTP
ncbi:MAG: alpha/beta-type small acid-soluble spore protein [Bacillota bacterium]